MSRKPALNLNALKYRGFAQEALVALVAQVQAAKAELEASFIDLDAARRQFAKSKSDDDKSTMDTAQVQSSRLLNIYGERVTALQAMLEVTDEELAEVEVERGSGREQLPRRALTADQVVTTADVNGGLAQAIETIEQLLPAGWLDEEPVHAGRLDDLFGPDAVLSITKGLRPESERPRLHRFRQALNCARDYRDGNLSYDHFAGALHVPTLVQLATQLDHLRLVGGNVNERLKRLWAGPSVEVDATLFELLTAARCASKGRRVAFITETSEKSPDLSCEDPFPLVIECKRQDSLTPYELAEEKVMRDVFLRLRQSVLARGLAGVFELRLTVEAKALDHGDVASTLLRQRLAAHSERALTYSWGTVAFRELPSHGTLPETTRAYSPTMLQRVFGWNMDLPEWDGLCCSIANARGGTVLDIQSPVGLLWSNSAPEALRKRTWAPTNLFAKAMAQVYPGAVGLIYVAYVEGARAEAADLRLAAYRERLQEWDHAGDIRVPISALVRLYPRPLGEGNPDLIESTVRIVSKEYGDPSLFDDFPSSIYTHNDLD
jgi:hypothetical protein